MVEVVTTIQAAQLRQVLGHFVTGFGDSTLTARVKPCGLAVGSSLCGSLEPPLLGVCAAKLARIGWTRASSGSPRLDGVFPWIACGIDAIHDADDHEIGVGRVGDPEVEQETVPLLFLRGGCGRFAV